MTAYIMHKHHLSVDEALEFVKAQRKLVFPNAGFIAQLHLFCLMNWQLDENNLQYRLYKLYTTAKQVQKDKQFAVVVSTFFTDEITPSQFHFKCKKCRYEEALFSEMSVFPHDVGKTLHWNINACSIGNPICNQGLLIRPLPWMQEAKEATAGKLNCPHCGAKIGSFDWNGSKCPCGARMEPIFYISVEKVDEVPPN
uniref:protein-tyrosine-phosphatase n=1 Tax=Strigamia maritima TaxID=126957 RepID=T1IVK8_STRMM